ncbi:hypothetical protein GQ457_17G007890 [Hibiscus cannabinus]
MKIESWASLIHCQREKFPSSYLGLSLGHARNSLSIWNPVLERLKKKLSTWKSKMLSLGGRITLVKSVLASLPVFFMSLFPLPASINKSISSLVAKFVWSLIEKRAIHWLVGKLCVCRNPAVICAKYAESEGDFIISPLMCKEDVFCHNIHLIVGNGKRIKFWFDAWARTLPLKVSFPRIFHLALDKEGSVADLGGLVTTPGFGRSVFGEDFSGGKW